MLLLDLDKIIRYDEKTQKFSLKGDSYNPLKNEELERKEQFYYGHKRMATKNLRSRIKGLTKTLLSIQMRIGVSFQMTISHC